MRDTKSKRPGGTDPVNITPPQRALLNQLKSETPDVAYAWDETRGSLSFVRSERLGLPFEQISKTAERAPEAVFLRFLAKYQSLFGPDLLANRIRLLRRNTDIAGFIHYQYQQILDAETTGHERAVEVYGSKLAAHFSPDNKLVEVQSSCYNWPAPRVCPAVSISSLQERGLQSIRELKGFGELLAEMNRRTEPFFPFTQVPRLVVYPWKSELIFAWATYGYGRLRADLASSRRDRIVFGQMFFEARTGELLFFSPTGSNAETPTVGAGFGGTPVGGPFIRRALQVVRVESGPVHLLKNTTRAREIITHNDNGETKDRDDNKAALGILNGSIKVSESPDGNEWNRTTTDNSPAALLNSQQPEVDAHATCAEVYDWYHAIGGRIGWDNGAFDPALVPPQTIHVIAHCFDIAEGTRTSANARFDLIHLGGIWVSYLSFFDGDPTGSHGLGTFNSLAGSRAFVAHEYQHAITQFSFQDLHGNPGLNHANWHDAIHEGLSDVFGGLFSGDWLMGKDVSPIKQVFRNLAFPRDPRSATVPCFDHFADCGNNDFSVPTKYARGTVLAHAAYLMAEGGVHQRKSRTPVFIPVRGLGREIREGISVYIAARIWYSTVADYLSNIGPVTGVTGGDKTVFRKIRDACVSAAAHLFQEDSREYHTVVLAFYAVGLHPQQDTYGADVTFLTAGDDWRFSRPHIRLTAKPRSSPDLFIRNGSRAEWTAKINRNKPGGATTFENKVYCRVRNIGDETATNVRVEFKYAKVSAGNLVWLPMKDKTGIVQSLQLGNMAAGQMNFPHNKQNTPPAIAMVKWYLPPLAPGEAIVPFSIRASVAADNDINPHNNVVQSEIKLTEVV